MADGAALRPLADALAPRVEAVTAAELAGAGGVRLLSIRFDGSMDARATPASAIAGRLFRAQPGDLVFSKIDVRNGAVGLVPADFAEAAFTSEFPVHAVRRDVALPEYLALVVRSTLFRQAINGLISGASGRKRVAPKDFLGVAVPLPPLPAQKAIVTAWGQDHAAAQALMAEADGLEARARAAFAERVGRPLELVSKPGPRCFALNLSALERWGVGQCRQALAAPRLDAWPMRTLADVCKLGSGGTPARAVAAYYQGGTVQWVKTTEVRDAEIFATEEAITEAALARSSAKRYPAGSLIVAMYGQGATRGRTAKLGIEAATNQACCVLHGFSPEVEPDYLWCYLMVEYDRLRALASGNNQPNLNAEMIAGYPLPLPGLEQQRTFARQLLGARTEAASLRQQAQQRLAAAHDNLERQLRGQLPMEPA